MKTLITSIIITLSLLTTVNAGMMQFSSSHDLVQQDTFVRSTLLGNRSLPVSAISTIYADVDTDRGRVSESELSWDYSLTTHELIRSVRHTKYINRPFPDPPEEVSFLITESISFDSFDFIGAFSLQNEQGLNVDVENNWVFDFPLEELGSSLNFSLDGTYTLSGYSEIYSIPFSYSLVRSPTSARGFIRPSTGNVVASQASYRLQPSQSLLYDGEIDGVRIQSVLLPINAPISIPEPSSIICLLPILFLLRKLK